MRLQSLNLLVGGRAGRQLRTTNARFLVQNVFDELKAVKRGQLSLLACGGKYVVCGIENIWNKPQVSVPGELTSNVLATRPDGVLDFGLDAGAEGAGCPRALAAKIAARIAA